MTFNLWTFLFQVVNFVVLVAVLRRLLYRPLQKAIQQRRAENDRTRAEAEQARKEAEQIQQSLLQERANLEHERLETLRKAHEEADAERKRLLADAERAAAARREELRQTAEQERAEALAALRGEVVGQAVGLARRLLQEAADQPLQRTLVGKLAAVVDRLGDDERSQLRADWIPADGATLEAAEAVDRETADRLAATVSGVLGQPVALQVRTNPELLAGARLTVAGHVWDVSLAAQLNGVKGPQP